jgi:2-methylcitrate dehydratase PrpD
VLLLQPPSRCGAVKAYGAASISVKDVNAIKVGFLPGADKPLIKNNPQTGLEGKFSVEYAVAAALADGHLDLESFTDGTVQRPVIQSIMKRVSRFRIPSNKMHSGIAGHVELVVDTKHATHRLSIDTMPGSLEWPLADAQKSAKFRTCAAQVLAPERVDLLQDLTTRLDCVANVASIGEAAAG